MTMNPSPKLLKNPFTVNCKSCNLPLTDSFTLLDYKNNYLIHSSVSSTPIVDKKKNSEDDNVYHIVKCRCHLVIGRKYVSTSADFNGYSGMFFINKEYVYTYSLGVRANDGVTNVCLTDLCEDIDKIQRLCLYLYKKIDDKK
ncbi:hypothetical protein P3W45_001690 [Vairimorpha bombi]|jgi:hypothetical protein